jgi:signal transduction histidine kinase
VDGAESREDWPVLVWFLRSRRLERIVLILCIAALVTEFFVLVLAGERLIGYVGLVLSAIGVLVARAQRMLGLLISVLGAVAAALLSSEFVATWTIVVFQLFSVTVRGTRAMPALLLAALPVYVSIVIREGGDLQSPVALVATACCAVGASVGSAVRAQERYLGSMRQRALDAEAAAHLAVERGVAAERLRIARDLHDAVGHEIAVVNMNIGVAEVKVDSEPAAARAALTVARTALQRVLRETQQILDILRRDEQATSTVEPVADVHHISDLVQAMRAGGASITADIEEDVGDLDAGTSAAAYRIAQEALTNASRHGIGTTRVSVSLDGDLVVVDVWNARAADAPNSARSGYGLVGMRERAESVGGTLDIEQPPGAFHVRALLSRGGPR